MLIVRFSAMGDVAMSLFAVKALRRTYPDLAITVATKPKFASFYRSVPEVSVLTLEPDTSLRSLFSLIKRAEASGITCVADIHNTIRGKLIRMYFALKGVKTAHFIKDRKLRKDLKSGRIKSVPRHNVLLFCDVFARLGFPVPDPVPEKSRRNVPEIFGDKTGRWAGFAPFASKMMKIYPEKSRTELIALLAGKFDRLFLFSGPGAELEYVRKMEQSCSNVTGVFGKTDIWGEMDLMSQLDVMITMDSSAMHMASLVGVPLLTIWGATHPGAGFYAYGYDPSTTAVQSDIGCRPCSIYGEGKCLTGDCRCLEDLKPETIMEKVEEIADMRTES